MFSFFIFLGHRVTRSVWESKLLVPCFCFPESFIFSETKVLASILHTKWWERFLYAKCTQENCSCRCTNKRRIMGKLWVGDLNIQVPHMSSVGVSGLRTFYTSRSCQKGGNRNSYVENRYKQTAETRRVAEQGKNEIKASNTRNMPLP